MILPFNGGEIGLEYACTEETNVEASQEPAPIARQSDQAAMEHVFAVRGNRAASPCLPRVWLLSGSSGS